MSCLESVGTLPFKIEFEPDFVQLKNKKKISLQKKLNSKNMCYCEVCYGWIPDCKYIQRRNSLSLPPPPYKDTVNNSSKKKPRKTRIPKEALEILRNAAKAEIKSKEETVQDKNPEVLKAEKIKKKPKTHFRKSKKPGRA